MERMTFYVPPVFLFGNNANMLHNNEEEKSEYKTAAETEIKVENWMAKRIAELEEENRNLNEKVRFLEECLDRKEKLNEKYREDLDECQCSFGFESDEVGFWKGEYKRLKKWIKDHCKGYGNLFPEDEMKRQWKKADKKRK